MSDTTSNLNTTKPTKSTRKPPKLKSDFAILDIQGGRHALMRVMGNPTGPTLCEPIPVIITGFLIGPWGDDDGTSREFEVQVTKVTTP
jgi:hypothetical protein